MKIIVITKNRVDGFQARVFGKDPVIQAFAETEKLALGRLVEKINNFKDKNI